MRLGAYPQGIRLKAYVSGHTHGAYALSWGHTPRGIPMGHTPSGRASRYNSSPLKSGLSPDAAPGVVRYQTPRTEDGGRDDATAEPVLGTRREHLALLVAVKTMVQAEQFQGALRWPICMRKVSARCTPAMALVEVS
ncbi:hypothetical protein CYMTET_10473 [Cymbomonas tetramitiformis]|uniref:Uncharacterized protein n=1 Tax=Cymbomonas tetramitiformis TaxID=36881 RepID=A0AAE0LE02_9CHLO|nr:hypothetical protein CYMTET_10473 [Cymbomonas tetramitiformis]